MHGRTAAMNGSINQRRRWMALSSIRQKGISPSKRRNRNGQRCMRMKGNDQKRTIIHHHSRYEAVKDKSTDDMHPQTARQSTDEDDHHGHTDCRNGLPCWFLRRRQDTVESGERIGVATKRMRRCKVVCGMNVLSFGRRD